jgi:nucleotide-binding universal stress UspA family protein
MGVSHVLVPLDGSPLADEALVHALDTFDCRVTVLYVITPIDSSMSEGGVLAPGKTRHDEAQEQANDVIDQARRRTAEADQRVETVVETGDPAETIITYVDEHDIDHVIIGGHGGARNELTRRLLGTVATVVVSKTTAPVTVIR